MENNPTTDTTLDKPTETMTDTVNDQQSPPPEDSNIVTSEVPETDPEQSLMPKSTTTDQL